MEDERLDEIDIFESVYPLQMIDHRARSGIQAGCAAQCKMI